MFTPLIWVQFFAHIPFVVNHAFNVTSKSGNKTIHCKIFAQTGFLLEKVQLKLSDDVSFAAIIYITLV